MYEVHAFTATAAATPSCVGPYAPGNRHAMLALLRQVPDSEPNWSGVAEWIEKAGWVGIKFERAGTLSPENLNGAADYLVRAYESAVHKEFGFVVYERVLQDDEAE